LFAFHYEKILIGLQRLERDESGRDRQILTVRLDSEEHNSPDYLMRLPPLTGGSLIAPSEETDDPKQEVAFDNDKAKEKLSTVNKEIITLHEDHAKDTGGRGPPPLALLSQYKEPLTSRNVGSLPFDLQKVV